MGWLQVWMRSSHPYNLGRAFQSGTGTCCDPAHPAPHGYRGRQDDPVQSQARRRAVLDVSLVHHPGWEIEHPLEAAGRALLLWPRAADAEADFASLPPVHSKDMGWLKGPTLYFLPGALGSTNLPPLSSSFDPMELLPQFTRGEGGRSPQRAWPQSRAAWDPETTKCTDAPYGLSCRFVLS